MKLLYKESVTTPATWTTKLYSIRFDKLNARFFGAIKLMAFCMMLSWQFNANAQCSTCTNGTTSTNAAITVTSGQAKCLTFNGNYNKAISVTSGTLCIGSTTTWNTATFSASGTCTINNYGTSSLAITIGSGVTFNNYGTYTGSMTVNGGTVVNMSGGTFSPSSLNPSSGSITNNSGGAATIPASTTFSTGSSFTNNGTVTMGAFTINSGASVTLTGTTQTLNGSVTNSGSFTYAGPGTLTGSLTINSGTTNIISGGLTVTGSVSNNGSISLSGGLTVNGAYSDNTGATITASSNSVCNFVSVGGSIGTNTTYNGNSNGLMVTPTPSCGACLTNGALAGTTAQPTAQPTLLTTAFATGSSVTVGYTAASPAPAGYIILRSVGSSAPSDVPVDGTTYTVGTTIGSCTVAAISSTTSITDNVNLSANCGNNVYYRIFSYNGAGKCINYLTTTPLTGSKAIPAIPTLSITPTNVRCFGASNGSAALTVTGSSSPYTYLWSNGSTVQNPSNLAVGTNTVTVTNYYGCTTTASTTLTQPASGFTTSLVTRGTCGTGTGNIDLTVSGATSPYTYLWSNAATSQDLTGVAPATYTVTVTDANSCTTSTSSTVSVSLAVTLSMASSNVSCFGGSNGSATPTPVTGSSPYTYVWSTGATTQGISGVVAGTYNVTVTDSKNCTVSASKPITQPAAVTGSISGTNITTCYGAISGAATLTPSGGTSPYTYLWSSTATTQNISSIGAGTYTVTITDANSCTGTSSVTITQPTQ